jgi:hypothetical protein
VGRIMMLRNALRLGTLIIAVKAVLISFFVMKQ